MLCRFDVGPSSCPFIGMSEVDVGVFGDPLLDTA